ncbi:hypothetical protein AAC387_Pa02g0761 [Persea americana]
MRPKTTTTAKIPAVETPTMMPVETPELVDGLDNDGGGAGGGEGVDDGVLGGGGGDDVEEVAGGGGEDPEPAVGGGDGLDGSVVEETTLTDNF